jgi:hypothetical protein
LRSLAARPRCWQFFRQPTPDTKADDGSHPFLVGHAFGTQNYVCAPSANGVAYVLFTPEATLVNDDGDQLITHFFSPNPDDLNDPNKNAGVVVPDGDGAIRATWQSKDGSSVWAKVHTDKNGVSATFIPDKTAVAWLLLDRLESRRTHGGNILSRPPITGAHHWRGRTGSGNGDADRCRSHGLCRLHVTTSTRTSKG